MSLNKSLENIRELISNYEESKHEKYLVYCSIELRMCLELITYRISNQYLDFMTDKQRKLYQPPQLMKILAEFEENIESDYILSINFNNIEKIVLGEYKSLPKYTVLRKMYNKLGSYIHYSKKTKKIDLDFIKETYEIINKLNHKNQIYGRLNNIISFKCSVCNTQNKITEHKIKNSVYINCLNPDCKILLSHEKINDNCYKFKPIEPTMVCDCGKEIYFTVSPEKINLTSQISCPFCKSSYRITHLNILKIEK